MFKWCITTNRAGELEIVSALNAPCKLDRKLSWFPHSLTAEEVRLALWLLMERKSFLIKDVTFSVYNRRYGSRLENRIESKLFDIVTNHWYA